jgi:hypothetical protein
LSPPALQNVISSLFGTVSLGQRPPGEIHHTMASVPELSYDIHHCIIQAVADASNHGADHNIWVQTLLACCLVDRAWGRLAHPLLNQTVLIKTTEHLNRRIFSRWQGHGLGGLRYLILRRADEWFNFNLYNILRALPNPELLRSFTCFDGALLLDTTDEMDRELVDTSSFSSSPLDLDLSGLCEAELGSTSFGHDWSALLLIVPNLQYLTFHGCDWCVSPYMSSDYATGPEIHFLSCHRLGHFSGR